MAFQSLLCRVRSVTPFAYLKRGYCYAEQGSTYNATFYAKDLVESHVEKSSSFPKKDKLAFGQSLTDHMMSVEYDIDGGWRSPQIHPLQNITLSPAASVLHYGLECFEGMKAYVSENGSVRLFRPDLNINRLIRSSKRLSLPDFDPEEFYQCLVRLIELEKKWIPSGKGFSLYIRPTHIATQAALGVSASRSSLLYIILSPVGPYFNSGFQPVSLFADSKNVRAWPGGIGDTKCGGNYAPTILPQKQAAAAGYNQVLWLFGPDEQVTEVGTMNLFMVWTNEDGEKELITAPLDGTILAGVTRQSILDLAHEWSDYKVSERVFTMPQIVKAAKEGRIHEMFGSGTAATVSPVKEINYNGKMISIPVSLGSSGVETKRFSDAIQAIQYGDGVHRWAPQIAHVSKEEQIFP